MQWQGQLLQWPEAEKHLHLAQLQPDGGQPAGEVQAVFLPINQPPATEAAVYLSDVSFQMQILCLRFALVWLAAAGAAAAVHKVNDHSQCGTNIRIEDCSVYIIFS